MLLCMSFVARSSIAATVPPLHGVLCDVLSIVMRSTQKIIINQCECALSRRVSIHSRGNSKEIERLNMMLSTIKIFFVASAHRITPIAAAAATNESPIWYPEYTRGFARGVCTSAQTAPDGIITFDSLVACCERSFAGQSSGSCLFSKEDEAEETLRTAWLPDDSNENCVSSEFVPQNGGPVYETQRECLESLVGEQKSAVWYPDYSRGWIKGVCVKENPSSVPTGIITFSSHSECCENGKTLCCVSCLNLLS